MLTLNSMSLECQRSHKSLILQIISYKEMQFQLTLIETNNKITHQHMQITYTQCHPLLFYYSSAP